jgi:hypothetical protein
MLTRFYVALAAALTIGYVGTSLMGWEWGSSRRQIMPASARQSPGGYRSFHFWHSGYQGGK